MQPSDVVVMENFVRKDTTGTIEQVDAKFELLQRGQYTLNANQADIAARRLNSKVPLELYEARNAVQIARWTGAERYAADTYLKATQGLENAEGYLKGRAGKNRLERSHVRPFKWRKTPESLPSRRIDEERFLTER